MNSGVACQACSGGSTYSTVARAWLAAARCTAWSALDGCHGNYCSWYSAVL